MRLLLVTALLGLLAVLVRPLPAQPEPSFSKDIKPFLEKYCLECHKGKGGKAGLDVSTYDSFKKGGISFPGFVPGKPNESFALELVEGRSIPLMPPKKSKQPTAEEKLKLRAWIAAGAKNDGASANPTTPGR